MFFSLSTASLRVSLSVRETHPTTIITDMTETAAHDANVPDASKPKPRITLLPASPAAFTAIATADLLAFSGVSGEPAARLISPFRRDLVRCGAHPRHWPDFQASVDSLWKGVREGKLMVMAIVEDPDAALLADGSTKLCGRGEQSKGLVSIGGVKGVVAGLAKLRPPVRVRQALINRQTKAKRLWGSYVVPAAKKVREKVVGGEADGTNLEFLGLFKAAMEEARKQNLTDEDWLLYVLNISTVYNHTYICCAFLFFQRIAVCPSCVSRLGCRPCFT